MSLVDGSDAVAILIACFAKFDVFYMIVGSLSSNAYGIPRATADADIVVENLEGAFEAIHQGLPSEFRSNPQIEFELMSATSLPFNMNRSTTPTSNNGPTTTGQLTS